MLLITHKIDDAIGRSFRMNEQSIFFMPNLSIVIPLAHIFALLVSKTKNPNVYKKPLGRVY